MGGNSLTPDQQAQQSALLQGQSSYYNLANQLASQQLSQSQPQIGIPQQQFQGMSSLGFSPQQVDPWSAYSGGYG